MALPVNIDDLINARTVESVRIEFKRGWNPYDILRTVCAFLNDIDELGGGYIIVGLEETEGTPILPPYGVEQKDLDGIQREFFKLCKDNIEPNVFPPIEVIELQGKYIIVIWITSGEQRPYYASSSPAKGAKKVIFVKHGSVTKEVDDNQERQLRELAAFKHFDDRINPKAKIEDLDLGLIQSYLQEIKSDLYSESLKISLTEIASKMQIARGPKENIRPLNVGLLMFTKDPSKHFQGCQTNLIEFSDERGTDYSEKIFKGPVHIQIRDVMQYLESNIIKQFVKKSPTKAESDTFVNYPYQALEEVIVNAMYHRSFEEARPNEIRIYKTFERKVDKTHDIRRIEVRSYPGPMPPIDNQALQQQRFNSRNYRNIKLGDWLKNIRLAEKYATGIPTIFETLAKNGSPKPTFWTDDAKTEFLVVLPIHEDTPQNATSPTIDTQSTSLTNLQQQILEQINNEPIERASVYSAFKEDINNDLDILTQKELLGTKQVGETVILFITTKGLTALRLSF